MHVFTGHMPCIMHHHVYVHCTLYNMCMYVIHSTVSTAGPYLHVMESASYLPHTQPMDTPMTSDAMSPPPDGEGLRGTLIRQLEYYFSKENLSSDKYLCK